MSEPFCVIDNGGIGGGCGHQSSLPIGPADGKHARGSVWSAHARGLKRFCSGQGSGAQAYGYIPRLADAAMDKIGQIPQGRRNGRSEEHTSELQSLMRISYAVFCLKQNKKKKRSKQIQTIQDNTQQNSARTKKNSS